MAACPFCEIAARDEWADLVAWRTGDVFVVIPPRQRPRNPGHALVLPIDHRTALSSLPPATLATLYRTAGRVGLAQRRVFGATGTTMFQNETAPDQVLEHLHVHVVPRFPGDGFAMPDPGIVDVSREVRAAQARALRDAMSAE